MHKTRRLTTAQAIIEFLKNQYVERDGRQHKFFGGMLGIFGHGEIASYALGLVGILGGVILTTLALRT